MASIVRTRLVKIGNSQGIRIPKLLLEQVGLSGDIEVEVEKDRLILRPATARRQGWDKQFQIMAREKDDRLLDGEALSLSSWEEEEWEW